MDDVEEALRLVKGFFNVHHASGRIKVRTAIEDTMDNTEPERSIKAVGKVHLLGYQYVRGKEEQLREVMLAIGRNRNATLHLRVATEKVRDMYPSPGNLGKEEVLAVLSEQILGEAQGD